MKFRLSQAVAAVVTAGAIPFAFAQDAVQYVQEPVASTSTTTGADGPLAEAIAQAINADTSLKNSKITVQPVDNGITLTGVTETYEQMQRAVKIATSQAGSGKVINAIQSSQMIMPAPEPSKLAEFEAAGN